MNARLSATTSTAGTNDDESVERDHPAVERFGDDFGAARNHGALMIARDAQLDDAERRYEQQQQEIRDDTQVHWRSRNSALKPGPKAAAIAMSPGLSGRFSSHS